MREQPSAQTKRLSEMEKDRLNEWYKEHGKALVEEVSRHLRKITKARTATSSSLVAASVMQSFLDHRVNEVDLTDSNSVWAVLVTAARRHCEAWNRFATRHPQFSLSGLAGSQPSADVALDYDAPDPQALAPEVILLVRECSALLGVLNEDHTDLIGQSIVRVEGGLELIDRLTKQERNVLGLKLATKTRPEIAQALGIENHEVDDAWKSIRNKAESI